METEQNSNILTPTLMAITAFLSRSPGLLNQGPGSPALSGTCSSFQHLLSNSNCSIGALRAPAAGCWFSLPHLIFNWLTSCLHPGYIIVRHLPSSCGRHKSHSVQPVHGQGYILISSTGCTCYLHRCISCFMLQRDVKPREELKLRIWHRIKTVAAEKC